MSPGAVSPLSPARGAVAIVLAAGSGDRLRSEAPKAFVPLGDRTLLARSVTSALESGVIASVVVAAPAGWEDRARSIVEGLGPNVIVEGGRSRQASVRAALAAISNDVPAIVCHDAARPFAAPALFDAVLSALDGWDGVVPVVPVADTVKRVREGAIERTMPREDLALAQTPQAFVARAVRDAHARAARDGVEVTDDAAALELMGYRVRVIDGEPGNFKITTAEDLARAEAVVTGSAGG